MLTGDCNVCINRTLQPDSAACVECGLSRKNYKPITNADRIRAMTDEEMAEFMCGVEAEAIRRVGLFVTLGDIERGKDGWRDWMKREADG